MSSCVRVFNCFFSNACFTSDNHTFSSIFKFTMGAIITYDIDLCSERLMRLSFYSNIVYMYISMSVCLTVCLLRKTQTFLSCFHMPFLFFCCLFASLSACMFKFDCLSLWSSVCLFVYINFNACLSVCMYLSVCL